MIPLKVKRTFHRQYLKNDCGIACLKSVADFYHLSLSPVSYGILGEQGLSFLAIKNEAEAMGLKVDAQQLNVEQLLALEELSLIAIENERGFSHAVLLYPYRLSKGKAVKVLVGDPAKGLKYCSLQTLKFKGYALSFHLEKTLKGNSLWHPYLKLWTAENYLLGILLVFWGAVASLLSLATPILLQRITDHLRIEKRGDQLYYHLALIGVCILLKSFIGYFRHRIAVDFNYQHFLNGLASWFTSLSRQTSATFQQLHPYDFKRIWRAHHQIAQITVGITLQVLNDCLLYVIWMGLCFYYDPMIGALLVMGQLSLSFYLWWLLPEIFQEQEQVEQLQQVTERQYLNWFQQKQSFGCGNPHDELTHVVLLGHEGFYQQQRSYGYTMGKIQTKLEGFQNLIWYGVILLLLGRFVGGKFSEGTLMAMVSILFFQMPIAQRLLSAVKNIYLQKGHQKRKWSFEHYQQVDWPNDAAGQAFESLILENVGLRRKNGAHWLFRNFNLKVYKRDFIVIHGANGCGKSSFLKALLGQMTFDEGNMQFNGKPNLHVFNGIYAYVPQECRLLEGSLLYNITLQKDSDLIHFQKFCTLFHLETFFAQFAEGLETLIIPEVKVLSGGQQKMICILRALYQKAQLLILDEPDAFLDETCKSWLLQVLSILKGQVTVILVSHDVRFVALSNREVVF
nr:ATP-binding cassette domain-containing protein [Pseudopedobacter sp.]